MELTALFNRADREIVGVDTHEAPHYRMLWTRHDFDPATDTRVVATPAGELVGGAFTSSQTPHVSQLFLGRVAPKERGRGIGIYLLRWSETRCRKRIAVAPKGARVSMHTWVYTGHPPTEELFASRGMKLTRHFVKMGTTLDSASVKGERGVKLALVIRHVENRRHLPAVELKRVA